MITLLILLSYSYLKSVFCASVPVLSRIFLRTDFFFCVCVCLPIIHRAFWERMTYVLNISFWVIPNTDLGHIRQLVNIFELPLLFGSVKLICTTDLSVVCNSSVFLITEQQCPNISTSNFFHQCHRKNYHSSICF